MERVTNVFCGGSGVPYTNLQSANNANATPEKPSRSVPTSISNIPSANNKSLSNVGTPSRARISKNRPKNVALACGGMGRYYAPTTWDELMQDDQFLSKFFLYFTAIERRILAQVPGIK